MTNSSTALLVIDVQRGLFSKTIPIYKADQLLDNIEALVARAQRADAPVIYVQHSSKAVLPEGSEDWQLHPRLKPLKKDRIIHKSHPSAFEQTGLAEELQARHVDRLIITGLVSHGCVRATSLDAKKRGYEVVLVEDAHSNYHKQAAQVIAEVNEALAGAGAKVKAAAVIRF
jgi:nicotinamidase-related amidase